MYSEQELAVQGHIEGLWKDQAYQLARITALQKRVAELEESFDLLYALLKHGGQI